MLEEKFKCIYIKLAFLLTRHARQKDSVITQQKKLDRWHSLHSALHTKPPSEKFYPSTTQHIIYFLISGISDVEPHSGDVPSNSSWL